MTILTSPEFWSAEAYRAKIKTPFELVASAVRTLDGRLVTAADGREGLGDGGMVLAREVARLGEPLYEAQPPTGYPDRAEAWVNTGALLGRMNFALGLAHNRLRGARVDLAGAVAGADRGQPAQVLDRLLAAVLHGRGFAGDPRGARGRARESGDHRESPPTTGWPRTPTWRSWPRSSSARPNSSGGRRSCPGARGGRS